ncbi:type II toxin-antitoxin system CcdA family antitoxin [Sphingomonas sp. ASY06-1R]|uniref:type II toxin-antitoxin system CcdA family antitoxin n=1 Tax=Sphingomonas sp. ASY06-1R TaxID=3445771 RepID=UPI003FA1EF7D
MMIAFLPNAAPRRPTNVSLNPALVAEARALGVNISRACERGLAEQIGEARAAQWLAENGAAVESSNAYAERHGLPLAASRLF